MFKDKKRPVMSSDAAHNHPSLLEPSGPSGFAARWEADRIGVILSVLCALHCIATPLILLLLPAFGEVWSHPAAHWGMALLVVPIALVLTLRAHKRHGRSWILITCSLGVLFILGGAIAPHIQHYLAQQSSAAAAAAHELCCPAIEVTQSGAKYQFTLGSVLTTLGGLLLVVTHIGNLRSCPCSCCSEHDHDPEKHQDHDHD